LKVALLGYGTIGSGVFELIEKNNKIINENYGHNVEIVKILVNRLKKYKNDANFNLFTDQFEEIKSSKPDIIIETIGGILPAYDYITYFLSKGIPVITANKDLIAERGSELIILAKDNNTIISYEASVGGGIPILKPLQECLAGNEITSISAVINGTTNYILTQMYENNETYDKALENAQAMGFAESDPTSDVEGFDAIRKLAILSSIGYKKNIKWSDLPTQGISNITDLDIVYAKTENLKIKLMAYSQNIDGTVYGAVRPVFITLNSKYAQINNEYNAVILEGDSVGELMFTGKGAGKYPTASAILGDLIDIIQNKKRYPEGLYEEVSNLQHYYPNPSHYVVRFKVDEIDSLTSKLFNIFYEHGIKISRMQDQSVVYVQVFSENEKKLIDTLESIREEITCDYSHYIIYEK